MRKSIVYCSVIISMFGCRSENSDNQLADSSIAYPDSVTIARPMADTLCFEELVGKDVTTVRLIIDGNSVNGNMEWLPWEKDRARGTLKGQKNGNEIIADYDYMIEGANQLEEKIFVIDGDKLLIKSGELKEKNGKLVMKDPTKARIGQTLTKKACQ
ncbi:hypothetical protein [Emticicia sp. 21SJ11W-3]|uniref:hypothetical protein n=1 Tax=Emticicia sp. 21SJ11W-3 TaxID=2916755 RepID=UPI00209D2CC6|nr:hypothetical protein [Emticicia sp. 21SJ11W-3]UTA69393.1 hypothetical protein MB380_06190 [Emticicia sp. 21SJ11W-3]